MPVGDLAELLTEYSAAIDAPVHTDTTVVSVRRRGTSYELVTDQGVWRADAVVLASGACNLASVPAVATAVPPQIDVLTPLTYRGVDGLADRGVLVVGASATGVQLADEIHRSGRPVTLAAGEHVRLPRMYRNRDIFWWMDAGMQRTCWTSGTTKWTTSSVPDMSRRHS
jgi:putative flavoprotein involved in K+ transport